jgi:arsenate reductase
MTTLYGIRNCDTTRKARRWLDAHGVDYRFHDVREDGLAGETLRGWIGALGWEALLNRRGTTWRSLPVQAREDIDAAGAQRLMLAHPACIRRPVLAHPGGLLSGFREADYAALFEAQAGS